MAKEDTRSTAAESVTAPETPRTVRRSYSRLGKILGLLVLLLAVAIGYLLLSPSPIDAVAYTPPTIPPFTGALEPNEQLLRAQRVAVPEGQGPEDVAVDTQGRIYVGTEQGQILRYSSDLSEIEIFASTGGRPLGLEFDAAGNLIVADGLRGLLAIDPAGNVSELVTQVDGIPVLLADDLDIAPDGRIYFSDASMKYPLDSIMLDMLEGRPHGRLIRYDPATGQATVLLDDLYFANGVAVSPDGEFVLVSETYRYRVRRYWLAGPRAGTDEVWVDGLPGFPDGVSTSERGTYWVAIFTPRNATADQLAGRPRLRNLLAKLPPSFLPAPQRYGLVLEMSADGEILRSLHDAAAQEFEHVTSAEEYDGYLYLGNLTGEHFHRLKLE